MYRPRFFQDHGFLNRGVGGYTTQGLRSRFLEEVERAKPSGIHLLGGINDIAGNGGPFSAPATQDNLAWMMAEGAASGCKVLVGSILPAERIPWNSGVEPKRHVAALNEWLRGEARSRGAHYVDYHTPLSTPAGALRPGLGPDGLHLNAKGYRVIEPVLLRAVEDVFGASRASRGSMAERARRLLGRLRAEAPSP